MGLSKQSKKNEVFDEIRKKHIPATPEELIRQSLIYLMIHRLRFPKELIAIEKQLSELPHLSALSSLPERRADIICFAKNIHPEYPLYPLLLIECKEGKVENGAIEQALGYNHYVQASYVAVAGSDGIQLVHPQKVPFLPSYPQLIEKLKNA
ncbi:MAG TPA: type I restriction enzyme HsdR N-terminal domain-containing protein [Rhabdochlamydiaceae bacterium]|nr:type I restriction enzyme HsdR N-terminal domain-containing protein [Rhabdochlamydiaceae bacterium]